MILRVTALAAFACLALAGTAAPAATVVAGVGADLSASPFTFNYNGALFTFGFNGDYFGGGPLTIGTASGGQVNTIFGAPTTNFADGRGGPLRFGSGDQYAAFGSATPIRFTNGDNFIGLRAITEAGTFYGYAFSSNNMLNTVGFETVADTPITATTSLSSAVPEPTTWALIIIGIGFTGAAMRRSGDVRMAVRFV
jgi:hypothetical protein